MYGAHLSHKKEVLGLAVFMAATPVLAQLASTPALGPAFQQISSPQAFDVNGKVSFPVAENGYLISHPRLIVPGRFNSVLTTSLTTGQTAQYPIVLSGQSAIRIESAAVTSTGHMLLAGSDTDSPNGGDILTAFAKSPGPQNVKNFVLDLDSGGHLVSRIDMQNYTPERICVGPDDSFWTLGEEWVLEGTKTPVADYALLRHFTASGVLLGSYLSRSTVARAIAIRNYHSTAPFSSPYALREASQAELACGTSTVGAYVARMPAGFAWIEVNSITNAIQQAIVRNPDSAILTGLVVLAPHVVYATFGTKPTSPNLTGSGQKSGIYRLAVLGTSATWQPVARSDVSHTFSALLGRDGASLLHLEDGPPYSIVFRTTP